jgi:MFS family permease
MLFTLNGRATRNFLGLLVLMHLVLFVDRLNLAAAASVMQKDLGLSNIALGVAFSAFNYSYAPFQMVGGWFADRFGARRTLTVCGLAWSLTTIATAAVTGLASLSAVRFVLGMGEGATLPAATQALSKWTSPASRGIALGITISAARAGQAMTAPIVAFLILWFSWRFSFIAMGTVSAVWVALWWRYFYEDPRRHPAITGAELAALPPADADPAKPTGSGPVPWRRLIPRMTPLMMVYFCQGWTGWLYVTWMPTLFQKNYDLDLKNSSFFYAAMLFSAMFAELVGGVLTDYLLRRSRSVQIARSLQIAVVWALAVTALVPAILAHDIVIGVAGFTLALFCMGMAHAPLWAAAIEIAPDYAGSSSALMNASGAVAGILSPVAFAFILDRTGSWTMPFAVSIGLLLFAIVVTYWIRPDRPIENLPRVGGFAVAGE